MNSYHLFIGGHCHGKLVPVTIGSWTWRTIEKKPIQLVDFIDWSSDYTSFNTVDYRRVELVSAFEKKRYAVFAVPSMTGREVLARWESMVLHN